MWWKGGIDLVRVMLASALLLLLLPLGLATGECVAMASAEQGLCYRYLSYTNVYVTRSAEAQVNLATLLQTYLSTFVDPAGAQARRSNYFPFACALTFPLCDSATGLPLFPCPADCRALIPAQLCGSIVPVAPEGSPCTPISGGVSGGARAGVAWALVALVVAAMV